MMRNQHSTAAGEFSMPAQPTRMPEFLVQHEHWFTRAALQQGEIGAGNPHRLLPPFLRVCCHVFFSPPFRVGCAASQTTKRLTRKASWGADTGFASPCQENEDWVHNGRTIDQQTIKKDR